MVLSSIAPLSADDTDELILEIGKNKESIKSLLQTKNGLMQGIDSVMRQRAQSKALLSCSQILDYREFSEFYIAESTVLTLYLTRLKEQMSQSRFAREVLRPQADLDVIRKGLLVIAALQERIIFVLQGMVNMAVQIYYLLITKEKCAT